MFGMPSCTQPDSVPDKFLACVLQTYTLKCLIVFHWQGKATAHLLPHLPPLQPGGAASQSKSPPPRGGRGPATKVRTAQAAPYHLCQTPTHFQSSVNLASLRSQVLQPSENWILLTERKYFSDTEWLQFPRISFFSWSRDLRVFTAMNWTWTSSLKISDPSFLPLWKNRREQSDNSCMTLCGHFKKLARKVEWKIFIFVQNFEICNLYVVFP